MPADNVEHRLECLGREWPGESVAGPVTERLDHQELPVRQRRRSMGRVYPLVGVLATSITIAVLVAVSFRLTEPQTLQAALRQSLRQATSWHVTVQVVEGSDVGKSEIWFHRDHGFRMQSADEVVVDDGTRNYSWSPREKGSPVVMRPSMDGMVWVARMFDISRIPAAWKKRRAPDLDQNVAGVPCEAFVYEILGGAKLRDSDERLLVMMDESNRIRNVVRKWSRDGQWATAVQFHMDYDARVPESKFHPDYPKDAEVVDVQSALDERFSLADAIAKGEKDGLIFAVHDLVPVDDGSWYVVSTVRGTDEYLRQYPPQKRRLNLKHTALDVASQPGSHSSSSSRHQILLFQQEWQGVDYLWRLVVLKKSHSPHDRPDAGTIRLPLYAHHRHVNRRDDRGVQLATRLDLDIPRPVGERSTLQQVVAKARADVTLVSRVFGESGSLPIAGSIKGDAVQFLSFDDITDEAYAKELRKTRWQLETNNWTGADPPEEWVPTIASLDADDSDDDTPPPPPKYGDDPVALPSKITGLVADTGGRPVAEARVTVVVRRYSKIANGESERPGPWSAVTNADGRYSIAPTGTIRPNHDDVLIKVVADGFADASVYDHEKDLLEGSFPRIDLMAGRRITGQLVDEEGHAVTKAIVRFQSSSEDLSQQWDSGPSPVESDGRFSVSIPADGEAIAAVYPTGFAPRFIDVSNEAYQGTVVLNKGVTLRGRVVDGTGNGVAEVVVGIRRTEYRIVHAYMTVIGTAVRTDEDGFFQLPALEGEYKLTVAKSAPDYSKQMMLVGPKPPTIRPLTIDTDSVDPGELILLQGSR